MDTKFNFLTGLKNFILSLFSGTKSDCIKRDNDSVAGNTHEEINSIFKGKKYPSVLGSKNISYKIKEIFFKFKDSGNIADFKF